MPGLAPHPTPWPPRVNKRPSWAPAGRPGRGGEGPQPLLPLLLGRGRQLQHPRLLPANPSLKAEHPPPHLPGGQPDPVGNNPRPLGSSHGAGTSCSSGRGGAAGPGQVQASFVSGFSFRGPPRQPPAWAPYVPQRLCSEFPRALRGHEKVGPGQRSLPWWLPGKAAPHPPAPQGHPPLAPATPPPTPRLWLGAPGPRGGLARGGGG